ncbi:MAG: DUF4404 family protein [Elusimicrobiota bacterium]|jgi:hypothetical protein
MLEETLRKLENAVRNIRSAERNDKQELLTLLTKLTTEVQELSRTHTEHAHSIAGFAELSAHEAARKDKSPDLLAHSVKGLSLSVDEFRTSHPRLVETIDGLCTMLARIGI